MPKKILQSAWSCLKNRESEKKIAKLKVLPAPKKAPKKKDIEEVLKRFDNNLKGIYDDLIGQKMFLMEPSPDLTHDCYQKVCKMIVWKDKPEPGKAIIYSYNFLII